MSNHSNFAGPGGAVAEEEKVMSYPNKEQIGNIEQELEKAELEFRRASDSNDVAAMIDAHNLICKLVANLSAAWSGGQPTVFSRFAEIETAPAAGKHVVEPMPVPAEGQPTNGEGTLDIADLERQLAELASKMQKCLESGDMDGMLQANEKMGVLSELMAKAEAKQREEKAAAKTTGEIVVSMTPETEAQAQAGASKAAGGAWAAGDTLALAKQRAEERKKQQKLTDSFESVVTEVTEGSVSTPAAKSTSETFFSDKMKAKMKDSGEKKAPKKSSMTQEDLRMKLEMYNFYEILCVPSTASFEELHKMFLRKILKLNKKLENKTLEIWQFQEFVAALSLAHDVLKNPNARLQYDLIILETEGASSAERTAKQKLMPLKEMIKFSTLIDQKELNEAVEKNSGTDNEREIGYYLVEKGLLSSEELDSILFAQKLVSNGKLTVAQFELAMQEMRENSIPLLDTLVASEWIQPHEVFSGDFA